MMGELPSAQEIVTVFAAFYREVREIGYGFLFVFLVLALIRELIRGMKGEADYAGLFVRTLLISGLFMIYTPLFKEITRGMELLANFYMPTEDFREATQKIFTAYKENHDLGPLAWLKMNFIQMISQATYVIIYFLFRAFGAIRVVLLSALYLTGPIFLGIGIFDGRRVIAWIHWVLEVLALNVVLSLFIRIFSEINFFSFYTQSEISGAELVCVNLALIVVIVIFVPMFTSMLVAGGAGFGSSSGKVLGAGTLIASRFFRRRRESEPRSKDVTPKGVPAK